MFTGVEHIYTVARGKHMTSYVRKCYDLVINKMAFQPPEPTYDRHVDNMFVYTSNGDKIAMRCVSDTGEVYSKPSAYKPEKGLIICAHGNADDIGTFQEYANSLARDQNANVLWFDYVGYGHSSAGTTTEKNMGEALTAVVDYGTNVLQVPRHRIVLFGKSIGTAATIRVAAKTSMREIMGVVLVSPLASGIRAFVPGYMAQADACTLLDSLFADNMHLISRVEVPVLMIHGYNDNIIDVVNTRLLQTRLGRTSVYPPLLVAAGHNDIESKV